VSEKGEFELNYFITTDAVNDRARSDGTVNWIKAFNLRSINQTPVASSYASGGAIRKSPLSLPSLVQTFVLCRSVYVPPTPCSAFWRSCRAAESLVSSVYAHCRCSNAASSTNRVGTHDHYSDESQHSPNKRISHMPPHTHNTDTISGVRDPE
jgi:hypothetical protein